MKPTIKQKEQFRTILDGIYPLGNECWSEIIPLLYIKELGRYEYFSKEGQFIREFGFIINGVLRVFYMDIDGKEWNEHFLLEEDFVISGISPDKKSITNIQALSKVLIICIPFDKFINISHKFQQINIFIQKLTFKCLEQKQKREMRLQSEKALSNYFLFKETFPSLEEKIQHYHIASYLGITPTQLSRLKQKNKNL